MKQAESYAVVTTLGGIVFVGEMSDCKDEASRRIVGTLDYDWAPCDGEHPDAVWAWETTGLVRDQEIQIVPICQ